MQPSTSEDQQEIVAALYRLASIIDHREWERVGEVLAADATAYGETGIDAVVTNSLRRNLGGCGPTQHLLGNHQVHIDGDRASSVTYVRAYHRGRGEHRKKSWECMGEYHDQWTRTTDGWRITARELVTTIMAGDISVLQPG